MLINYSYNYMKSNLQRVSICIFVCAAVSGCWLAAGAVGAEAGYIASQDDRTAGETIDDQTTLASLKSKLLSDPEVSGMAINVDVNKGNVTLRGYLKSQSEINKAIAIARSTNGVKSVNSKLVLDS